MQACNSECFPVAFICLSPNLSLLCYTHGYWLYQTYSSMTWQFCKSHFWATLFFVFFLYYQHRLIHDPLAVFLFLVFSISIINLGRSVLLRHLDRLLFWKIAHAFPMSLSLQSTKRINMNEWRFRSGEGPTLETSTLKLLTVANLSYQLSW